MQNTYRDRVGNVSGVLTGNYGGQRTGAAFEMARNPEEFSGRQEGSADHSPANRIVFPLLLQKQVERILRMFWLHLCRLPTATFRLPTGSINPVVVVRKIGVSAFR